MIGLIAVLLFVLILLVLALIDDERKYHNGK